MKAVNWRKLWRGASLQRDLEEIRDLFVRYVKEETIDPLKQLGRFVLWGVIGSLFVGFGAVLLLLGALRYLQWQFPVLDGSLSFIPYVAVTLLGVFAVALTLWRIFSAVPRRRSEK